MEKPDDYETKRKANIAQNQALMLDLGLAPLKKQLPKRERQPRKKPKTSEEPKRISARLATRPARSLKEAPIGLRSLGSNGATKKRATKATTRASSSAVAALKSAPSLESASSSSGPPPSDIEAILRSWTAWSPVAPAPTRDENGSFHFVDYPTFQPNKSPAEILREGAFGGSYYRPLYSKKLRITVRDDWRELPKEWLEGIDPYKYLLQTSYDAETNKAGVVCGQSIEEWEANGWIAHDYDVRGWYQWYTRFFQGRRCPDDDRQVGRWSRCAGPKGRWKRMLLKQYLRHGIRHVNDEGDEDEGAPEVSPVITQTCLHWAYEVRQGDLDEAWESGL